MTIYKFPLQITDNQIVMMPINSKIITVQMQSNTPCLWAEVEPTNTDKQSRSIEIFGTGHLISNEERTYIGTVQQAGGSLVWHVYERL